MGKKYEKSTKTTAAKEGVRKTEENNITQHHHLSLRYNSEYTYLECLWKYSIFIHVWIDTLWIDVFIHIQRIFLYHDTLRLHSAHAEMFANELNVIYSNWFCLFSKLPLCKQYSHSHCDTRSTEMQPLVWRTFTAQIIASHRLEPNIYLCSCKLEKAGDGGSLQAHVEHARASCVRSQ